MFTKSKAYGLLFVAALALGSCATPYPTRYAPATFFNPAGGVAGGLSSDCKAAINTPSNSERVVDCLQERARGWETIAARNRQLSRGAGAFAIPAAAVALALTAEGDPNHAVLPIGLATGSLITYAQAYAKPDEAEVAERAVAAYNCLLSAAAEWKADPKLAVVEAAYTALNDDLRDAAARFSPDGTLGLRAQVSLASQVRQAEAELTRFAAAKKVGASGRPLELLQQAEFDVHAEAQRAQKALENLEASRRSLGSVAGAARAAHALATGVQGQAGARLLQRSDVIDQVAIGEIAKRQLAPGAVASNARQSIQSVADKLSPPPPAPAPGAALQEADPCAEPNKRPGLARACVVRGELRRAADAAEQDAKEAAEIVADLRGSAEAFDAAVKATKALDPTLGQACVVAVTQIPTLSAAPASLKLADGKGSFKLSGGLGLYSFDTPPAALSVVFSSSTDRSVRVEIAATAATPAEGKWDLTFYDGGVTPSSVTVTVERP
jgi:hypothetical protein